ncbi:MAG: hypothetical protein P8N02_06150 [Actinomycetota bacterium]|nr:hypothetical protein [Actinomycetota bacterium]
MPRGSQERQRASLLLLAVAGALAGHVIGYGIVGSTLGSLHDYVGATATIVVPFAAAALGLFGLRLARNVGVDLVTEQRRLTTMMLAVYGLQEVGERLVAGHQPAVAELLPIAAGLLVQPLIAWTIVRLAALVGQVIEGLTRPDAAVFSPPPPRLVPARMRPADGRRIHHSRSSRGPPRN